jgi:hypothetical protein
MNFELDFSEQFIIDLKRHKITGNVSNLNYAMCQKKNAFY